MGRRGFKVEGMQKGLTSWGIRTLTLALSLSLISLSQRERG
jgi:hypothetical protein